MAPKGGRGDEKAEWKAVDGDQAKSGGGKKGGGRGGGGAEGAPWNNGGEGSRKGGNRKGGKGDSGGGERWNEGKGGGWNQGGGNRGGDDYYEGGYGGGGFGGGYGAGGYGAGMHPWSQGAQDWQPDPTPPAPRIWTEYQSPDGNPYYYNCKTGLTQWERPAELDPPKPEPERPRRQADGGDDGKGSRGPRDNRDNDRRNDGEGRNRRDGGGERRDNRGGDGKDGGENRQRNQGRNKKEGGGKGDKARGGKAQQDESDFGPPGCNLFVFHLPDDWNDEDLNEYFAPHGTVMSAKVMKELGTGRSRGFGFVSYEDRVSAATAIKKMQGYKILGKRLKVEFKKGEGQDGILDGTEEQGGDEGSSKKSYPDDERLIGYLRAISAKNVVQSLKENEGAPEDGDAPPDESEVPGGMPAMDDEAQDGGAVDGGIDEDRD